MKVLRHWAHEERGTRASTRAGGHGNCVLCGVSYEARLAWYGVSCHDIQAWYGVSCPSPSMVWAVVWAIQAL